MKTASRKIIDQRAERLRINERRRWHLQNRHLIRNRDISTHFTDIQTSPIIWTIGVIFPFTCVSVGFVVGAGNIPRCICCVRRCNGINLEDRIWNVDKTLELLVALRGRVTGQPNVIGVPYQQCHRPTGANGCKTPQRRPILHICYRIAALRNEMFHI